MIPKARFGIRLAASLYLGAALAGCATTEPRIVYREVKVPVSVPCKVELPEEPTYAAAVVDLAGDIYVLAQSLLVEREQRKARDVEVTAAARSCS